jgi:hypothetical protein
MRGQTGSAAVDWVAAVAMVAAMMAGLVVLGSHRAPRRPPVDPIRALAVLVAPPPRVVVPRPLPPVTRPRRTPAHPRKKPHRRPRIDAPGWVWR